MDKKALGPSTMMIILAFIVILVVVILLAIYLGSSAEGSGIFQYSTDWKSGFKWT
jgi:hypothetical protein